MLTDDDCRAIREAIGQPAMSFDRVRELVRAINAMQDGPVWVVPRRATQAVQEAGYQAGAGGGDIYGDVSIVVIADLYDTMTAAGAAAIAASDAP